jgi:isomerase DpgB
VVTATGLTEDLVLHIDGATPMSTASVEAVQAFCDRVEDGHTAGLATIHVSGVPRDGWIRDLSVGLVSKWERALRRLERLTGPTVTVASGDCGGIALDVLLATDFRIATPDTRLLVAFDGEATWPGMSLYRLACQAGPGRIRRVALLGAVLDAREAQALHLVDEVADDPDTALAALAERASAVRGKEFAIRRQLLFDAAQTSFEDALGAHLAACDRALRRGVDS